MTAEFAVALPAIILILAAALGAIQLAGEQLRLQSAVAAAARAQGRGETDGAAEILEVSSDAVVVDTSHGDLSCVEATVPVSLGILVGITLQAESCALSDGQ